MINNTDSLYSFTIPVEYPKVGENPSGCTIWFYDRLLNLQKANIDGDEVQHYIPRMEWVLDSKSVILQQLNRKQNQSKIIVADANSGVSKTIHTETDPGLILSPVGMIMIPADGIGLIMVKNFMAVRKDGWSIFIK